MLNAYLFFVTMCAFFGSGAMAEQHQVARIHGQDPVLNAMNFPGYFPEPCYGPMCPPTHFSPYAFNPRVRVTVVHNRNQPHPIPEGHHKHHHKHKHHKHHKHGKHHGKSGKFGADGKDEGLGSAAIEGSPSANSLGSEPGGSESGSSSKSESGASSKSESGSSSVSGSSSGSGKSGSSKSGSSSESGSGSGSKSGSGSESGENGGCGCESGCDEEEEDSDKVACPKKKHHESHSESESSSSSSESSSHSSQSSSSESSQGKHKKEIHVPPPPKPLPDEILPKCICKKGGSSGAPPPPPPGGEGAEGSESPTPPSSSPSEAGEEEESEECDCEGVEADLRRIRRTTARIFMLEDQSEKYVNWMEKADLGLLRIDRQIERANQTKRDIEEEMATLRLAKEMLIQRSAARVLKSDVKTAQTALERVTMRHDQILREKLELNEASSNLHKTIDVLQARIKKAKDIVNGIAKLPPVPT